MDDLRTAQVLSSMATIAVLNHHSYREQEILTQQLQAALTSRVLIEQAKGMLAEREGLTMDHAFDVLRRTARSQRRLLSDVAADLVSGRWSIDDASPGALEPGRPTSRGGSDPSSTPSRRRRSGPRSPGER